MKPIVHVHLYYNAAKQPRWYVAQTFPASATTEGHATTLRQNFTSQESAERYAERVREVGFEYA